jgi:hypothetical protein
VVRSATTLLLCAIGAACGDNLAPDPSCRAGDFGPMDGGSASVPAYDEVVLADGPVAFWDMSHADTELDLTGNGHAGTYHRRPALAAMPDGDLVADFDGTEYLSIPSSAALSIPTTGSLTWEAWIKPDALTREHSNGYVNWMGKCASYSPTCEWEARFYDSQNDQGRCNRFSAYAFNPTAGLGAGAAWQPVCGLLQDCQWHHVVGEYTTLSQPADCPIEPQFPGSIDIWVDGVEWSQASHTPTGCMSQFGVVPVAHDSPLNIGSSALDSWFDGAIGKVAIYDYLLGPDRIASHFQAMTGHAPSGSCGETCTIP